MLSILLIFYPINFDFIINELVDVSDNCCTLNVHQDEAWNDLRIQSRVSSSGRAWVYVELVFVLIRFKLVCMSSDQNITIKLSEIQ